MSIHPLLLVGEFKLVPLSRPSYDGYIRWQLVDTANDSQVAIIEARTDVAEGIRKALYLYVINHTVGLGLH